MAESQSHKSRKRKAAGKLGRTEYPLPRGGRLDAVSVTRIGTEVERGGPPQIRKAVTRLKRAETAGIIRKPVLKVNNSNLDTACGEMRRQRLGGVVTNLGGTTKKRVPKRRK